MVGWHHPLNGHEFEQTLGDGERQGSLVSAVYGSQSQTQLSNRTTTTKGREVKHHYHLPHPLQLTTGGL